MAASTAMWQQQHSTIEADTVEHLAVVATTAAANLAASLAAAIAVAHEHNTKFIQLDANGVGWGGVERGASG